MKTDSSTRQIEVELVPDIRGDKPKPASLLLAAAVIAAPLLITANSLFHPTVEMSGESILAGARTGPTTWFVVHVVAASGALLGVPAAFGLRELVPGRARRLATSGLAFALLGAPILAMSFAAEASVLRLAAADLDVSAGEALAEAYTGTPEFYAVGLGVVATTLGSLLLGLALHRSGAVARWQATTYLLATLATVIAPPGTAVGPAAFGVVTLVSVSFAVRVARVRDRSHGRIPAPAGPGVSRSHPSASNLCPHPHDPRGVAGSDTRSTR